MSNHRPADPPTHPLIERQEDADGRSGTGRALLARRGVSGWWPWMPAGEGAGAVLAALLTAEAGHAPDHLRQLARSARMVGDARLLARYRRMALVADAMTGDAAPGATWH